MSEWQPIETAPIEPFNKELWFYKHSPYLLLAVGKRIEIGSYHYTEKGKGSWRSSLRIICPDHWMPLPDPPEQNS